jgi:hypothetical protein
MKRILTEFMAMAKIDPNALVIVPEELNLSAQDRLLRRRILECIELHYPDHAEFCAVTVLSQQNKGIIQVRHMGIDAKYGYQIPIAWVENDPELKYIVQYTGELLERYCIPREKGGDVIEQLQGVKRNNLGEAVHER